MQSFLGLFIVGDDGSRLVCLTSSAEVLVFRPGECARVAHLERRIHPASLANSYLFGFSTEEGHYLTFGQLQYASKLRLRVEDCNTVYHDSPAALDHLDLFKPSRDEQDTNKASIESCLERCGPSAVRTAVLRGVALIRHHGDAHAAYHAAYHLLPLAVLKGYASKLLLTLQRCIWPPAEAVTSLEMRNLSCYKLLVGLTTHWAGVAKDNSLLCYSHPDVPSTQQPELLIHERRIRVSPDSELEGVRELRNGELHALTLRQAVDLVHRHAAQAPLPLQLFWQLDDLSRRDRDLSRAALQLGGRLGLRKGRDAGRAPPLTLWVRLADEHCAVTLQEEYEDGDGGEAGGAGGGGGGGPGQGGEGGALRVLQWVEAERLHRALRAGPSVLSPHALTVAVGKGYFGAVMYDREALLGVQQQELPRLLARLCEEQAEQQRRRQERGAQDQPAKGPKRKKSTQDAGSDPSKRVKQEPAGEQQPVGPAAGPSGAPPRPPAPSTAPGAGTGTRAGPPGVDVCPPPAADGGGPGPSGMAPPEQRGGLQRPAVAPQHSREFSVGSRTLMAACTIAGLARDRGPARGPGPGPDHNEEEEEDGTEAVTSGAAVEGEPHGTTSPLQTAPGGGAQARHAGEEQQRRPADVVLGRVPTQGDGEQGEAGHRVLLEARPRRVRPGGRSQHGGGAGPTDRRAVRQEAAAPGVGLTELPGGKQRHGVSGEGMAARVAEASAEGQGAERVAAPVRQEGAAGVAQGPQAAAQGPDAQAPGVSQQQQLEEEEEEEEAWEAAKPEARAVREQLRGQPRPPRPPRQGPQAAEGPQQPQHLVALPQPLLPEGPQQDIGADSAREEGSEQTQQQQQPAREPPAEEEVEEAGGDWGEQGPSAHTVGEVPAGATVAELQAAMRELQLAKARLEVALAEERAAGVAREQQLLVRLAEAEGRAREAEKWRLQALLGQPGRE